MHNFSIKRVNQYSNEEINSRLKELISIQNRLEQSMRINRNCHSAVIGTHYDAVMLKWTLQSKYHSMDMQYLKALNEEIYLQYVLEDRAHDELSSPHEYEQEDKGDVDNPAEDGISPYPLYSEDDDLPF